MPFYQRIKQLPSLQFRGVGEMELSLLKDALESFSSPIFVLNLAQCCLGVFSSAVVIVLLFTLWLFCGGHHSGPK